MNDYDTIQAILKRMCREGHYPETRQFMLQMLSDLLTVLCPEPVTLAEVTGNAFENENCHATNLRLRKVYNVDAQYPETGIEPLKVNVRNSQWLYCPKCKSEEIETGFHESDETYVWRTANCECGFEWVEFFSFSHNEDDKHNELDHNGNSKKGESDND